MSSIRVYICATCNRTSKDKFDAKLSLNKGKGENKQCRRTLVCDVCFEEFLAKIDDELDINEIFNNSTRIKSIDDGEKIIPSKAPPGGSRPNNNCPHEKSSYEHPYIICKSCGEEWLAE